jgi:TPR repeat protein
MKPAKLICLGLLYLAARHSFATVCINTGSIVTSLPVSPVFASQHSGGSQATGAAQPAVLEPNRDPDIRGAINRLAIMYARGRGVKKDYKAAFALFKGLALDGYTPGMVNLGILYELAPAGSRSHRRAYAWIRAALLLGVPNDDYDATVFKLGLIAGKLDVEELGSAERLAATIAENVATHCDSSFAFSGQLRFRPGAP